jgi:hypothetical protein
VYNAGVGALSAASAFRSIGRTTIDLAFGVDLVARARFSGAQTRITRHNIDPKIKLHEHKDRNIARDVISYAM